MREETIAPGGHCGAGFSLQTGRLKPAPQPWRPAILAVLVLLAAVVRAEELRSEDVTISVGKSGWIEGIRFQNRQVVVAREGLAGAAMTVTRAGGGSIDSLFANEPGRELGGVSEKITAGGNKLAITGQYTDGTIRIPFTRTISLDGRTVGVVEEVDSTAIDAAHLIASHALELPLVVCADEHLRMFGFGSRGRAELFRMDMNDINRGDTQLISAPRGHWPYWDIGGVLQTPGAFRIWKANHADTMAYPLDNAAGAPGWADYSELDWGITAIVDEPDKSAPWAMVIDARKGVFSIQPHPASQLPASGKDYGKRRFAFKLVLHETSWPAAHPCELDPKRYEELLKSMGTSNGKPVPWVLYRVAGTADIPTIIHRERIQPSAMLRSLYRGDAYQMQGRMKSIGKTTPRNQPMEQWEKDAAEYLEHVRKNGVPQ